MLQNLNLGTTPNDKTGTTAKAAGQMINDNFAYLEAKIDNAADVITEAGFLLASNVLTFNTGSQWIINGQNYTNPAAVPFTIPLAAAGKTRYDLFVYNTSNTFSRILGIEAVSAPVVPAKTVNTIKAVLFLVSQTTVSYVGGVANFKGSIVPTDTPTGTEDATWIATQAGTYTNFGGKVVNANSRAEISRVNGVFSISQTAFDISGKENTSNKTATVAGNETSTTLYASIKGMVDWLTSAKIKSILGIITLSGSNTGDQDLILPVTETGTSFSLTNAYNGGTTILTASCTVTIPNGLIAGFEHTIVTLAGVTLTVALGGSVTLFNNAGTTMAEKLSCTIKNRTATNQYITAGNL